MLKWVNWLKEFFRERDRRIMLVCVGIALVFWFTKAMSEDYSHDYKFELDYQLPDNLSFVSPSRQYVEARLSGTGWQLFKASLKRHFSVVPLPVSSDQVTRTDIVTAIYAHLGDYEIAVRDVDTDIINLNTDIRIDKMVPVVLKNDIVPAEGYMLSGKIAVDPPEVTVSGPASVLESIREISTVQFKATDLAASFNAEVELMVPESEYVQISAGKVRVACPIDRIRKVFREVPVVLIGDTSGNSVSPQYLGLEFRVPESQLEALD